MAHPSFDFSALSTLNLWLMTDAYIHTTLNADSYEDKLDAIARGASRFGYSNELNSRYDARFGIRRFQPALDVIDELEAESFADDTVGAMLAVSNKLSHEYGNNYVFSATTKLLWLKFRYPIIIYDERAAMALGTEQTNEYFDQWRSRFRLHKQSVANACSGLIDALTYVYDPAVATREFVQDVSSSTWFQHRVFGAYLTYLGRGAT